MAFFRVLLTRDTSESTSVIVRANGKASAINKAFDTACGNPDLIWTPDDYAGDAYLGDPEEAAEKLTPEEAAAETEHAAAEVAQCDATRARERVAAAAQALLDAFGGNVPDWLTSEATELHNALQHL